MWDITVKYFVVWYCEALSIYKVFPYICISEKLKSPSASDMDYAASYLPKVCH